MTGLEGPNLSCDQLQFSYQKAASTTMCTWAISAVIDHYNNQGREVFGCTADISKAFDMCSWLMLFKELFKNGISALILRVLLFIYINQACDGHYSERFYVSNGVRQGAVSSCILFCIYLDILIKKLRNSGIGCHIEGEFAGIFVYADDIFLLSPSRPGLQAMISTSEEYASEYNFTFSTNVNPDKSKTKCIIFTKNQKLRTGIDEVILNGLPLPWVDQVNHLGNLVQFDNSFKSDCSMKKGKFVTKVHTLLQEFFFVPAEVMLKLIKIYATSFYSSSLWDLSSVESEKISTSWNKTVRMVFNLPYKTHNYLIEEISDSLHVKTMLWSRFVQFHESLINNKKPLIRLLASLSEDDIKTTHGRNIHKLLNELECNLNDLSSNYVKQNFHYKRVPVDEQWRIPLLFNLMEVRNKSMELINFLPHEINTLIEDICVN